MITEYPKIKPHGIMFHHFHGEKHFAGQGSISAYDLEKILRFLNPNRILSPNEWLRRLAVRELTHEDICLTFDDGLLSQFEIALPVLEKYNLKAFWFIYSNVFENGIGKFEVYRVFRSKYFNHVGEFYESFFSRISESEFKDKVKNISENTINQYKVTFPFYSYEDIRFRMIRDHILNRYEFENILDSMIDAHGINLSELTKNLWMTNENLVYLSQQGHVVGLHSYSHPTVLANLSFEEQLEEYSRNYNHISKICQKVPMAMAHPVNSYNEDTFEVLNRLNVNCGFLSNMHSKREFGSFNQNNYELAREDHSNIMRMMM